MEADNQRHTEENLPSTINGWRKADPEGNCFSSVPRWPFCGCFVSQGKILSQSRTSDLMCPFMQHFMNKIYEQVLSHHLSKEVLNMFLLCFCSVVTKSVLMFKLPIRVAKLGGKVLMAKVFAATTWEHCLMSFQLLTCFWRLHLFLLDNLPTTTTVRQRGLRWCWGSALLFKKLGTDFSISSNTFFAQVVNCLPMGL